MLGELCGRLCELGGWGISWGGRGVNWGGVSCPPPPRVLAGGAGGVSWGPGVLAVGLGPRSNFTIILVFTALTLRNGGNVLIPCYPTVSHLSVCLSLCLSVTHTVSYVGCCVRPVGVSERFP